jgi:hypothetical protein
MLMLMLMTRGHECLASRIQALLPLDLDVDDVDGGVVGTYEYETLFLFCQHKKKILVFVILIGSQEQERARRHPSYYCRIPVSQKKMK